MLSFQHIPDAIANGKLDFSNHENHDFSIANSVKSSKRPISHILHSFLGIKEIKNLNTYRGMVAELYGTLILVFVGVGMIILNVFKIKLRLEFNLPYH